MFRSKSREVIVPQSEHARLAGALALHWGNTLAGAPELPRRSFLTGVIFHDRGFGYLDTVSIGEAPDEDWLPVERRGALEITAHDPIADIVVCRHIRRLVSMRATAARAALSSEIDLRIASLMNDCRLPAECFDSADRITAACDLVAFDFSFEAPRERTVVVPSARPGEDLTVTVSVDGNGGISLRPWPLSIPSLDGYIIGYEADGYPDRLSAVTMPYTLRSRE